MSGLDPGVLDGVFRSHLGDAARVLSVERGPVGNGQETWFVGLEDGRQLVLRRTATGGPLDWTDRQTEYRVLSALSGAGLPTPAVYWSAEAGTPLERPYFVMDRLPGDAPHRLDDATATTLAGELGHWLGRLHDAGVDPEAAGLETPADNAAATREELGRWQHRYSKDRPAPVPLIAVLLAWLDREAPTGSDRPSLLWGDPGPYNVLHEKGIITGLLDWELAHAGDPAEDVGAASWSCLGVLDREVLIAAYEEERGVSLDRERLRYFEVMACVTRSIMLLNGVQQYLSGATNAPNIAGLGLQLVSANLLRAVTLLGHRLPILPAGPSTTPDPLRPRPDRAEIVAGVTRFLEEEVLPELEDSRLRRGLRTVGPLLATAAHRASAEPAIEEALEDGRSRLLDTLSRQGVTIERGFEETVVMVEREPALADVRPLVWGHLLVELAATRELAAPLIDLYEAPAADS